MLRHSDIWRPQETSCKRARLLELEADTEVIHVALKMQNASFVRSGGLLPRFQQAEEAKVCC